MMPKRGKIALGLGLFVLMIVATFMPRQALASLVLELKSGNGDIPITDGGTGDTNPTAGIIAANSNVLSNWTGTVDATENTTTYQLASSGSTLKGPTNNSFSLATTETFTVYGHAFDIAFNFQGFSNSKSSVLSDTLFVDGSEIKRLGGTGNFSSSYQAGDFAPGVHTIEELVTFNQTNTYPHTFSSSADFLIPEPLTLSLFAVGLFGIVILRRLKRP